MLDLFTTRKIVSGLILLIVGLVVTYLRGDIPPGLLSLEQWLFVSFVAGNTAQHVTTMMLAKKQGDDSAS